MLSAGLRQDLGKNHLMDEKLAVIFASYEGKQEELIPILQGVQQSFGYLSEEAMRQIARFTGVTDSRVFAVATFYSQFRFTPRGRRHVMVCRGTACYVRGAPRLLETVEKHLACARGNSLHEATTGNRLRPYTNRSEETPECPKYGHP